MCLVFMSKVFMYESRVENAHGGSNVTKTLNIFHLFERCNLFYLARPRLLSLLRKLENSYATLGTDLSSRYASISIRYSEWEPMTSESDYAWRNIGCASLRNLARYRLFSFSLSFPLYTKYDIYNLSRPFQFKRRGLIPREADTTRAITYAGEFHSFEKSHKHQEIRRLIEFSIFTGAIYAT